MSPDKIDGYFLATSDYNRTRLEILNRVYNQATLNVLVDHGLKKVISILVCECSAGFFAIELAKYLGSKSNVVSIVIDSDEDSLNKARDNAKKANVHNIEFKHCNIEDMSNLNLKFDLIYGRWVLIFTQNIKRILSQLVNHLKPGGKLICEELNFEESGHFSYPHEDAIDKYHQFALSNSIAGNLNINLANTLYHEFKQQSLESIDIKINQPILITEEEKSVYRLGLITMSKAILNNNLCTETELKTLIDKFNYIEKNDTVIGCFRNLIIRGSKPL